MDQKTTLIKKLENFKKEISEDMQVKKMIFFGPRATGNYKKESDIDLIIVSPKFKGVKFRERPIRLYNHWNINHPVDFLCYTPQEFRKKSSQTTIVQEAVKKGIELS